MEAMAVGMPLVTMATANFLDALQDGFNCLLAWDEGHAVEQIERLLSDRRMAERIGRNARETIVKRTSTEICQNAWDKLFRLMASGTMSQDQTRASGAP
jgi:glycosyltransferase involved in cell wall biosynthesis